MIRVGSCVFNINVEQWFFCWCVGCGSPFWTPIDPRVVESYRCPNCLSRIDSAPRHGLTGMVPPDVDPVRLGDGLFLGLPASMERSLDG